MSEEIKTILLIILLGTYLGWMLFKIIGKFRDKEKKFKTRIDKNACNIYDLQQELRRLKNKS